MAQFQRHFVQELTKPLIVRQCGDLGFTGDNLSDAISVDLYTDGVAYSGGGTCAGACICPDGSTVALSGSVSGKTASVSLTEDCFAIPGQIGIAIRVTSGTTKTTVLKAIYNVDLFATNNPVDPGSRITLDVGDLVNRIDAATADIPASDMASLMAGIAPTFSATTAYSAGAYVYYNGTLYRFTADHAAGSWAGTDATAVVLGNDVADLKSAVDDSLFTDITVTWNATNAYIKIADGTFSNSQFWKRTDMVAIPEGAKGLYYTCPVSSNDLQVQLVASVAFYSTDDPATSYISTGSAGIKSGSTNGLAYTYLPIPATAKYMRLSVLADFESSYNMQYITKAATDGNIISLRASDLVAIPSGSDLDDYKTVGNYSVLNAVDAQLIDNYPFDIGGRIIIGETNNVYSFIQVAVSNAGGVKWRIYANDSWTDWMPETAKEELSGEALLAMGDIATAGITDLNNIGENTIYRYVTSDIASLSNFPKSITKSGLIITISGVHQLNGRVQFVIPRENNFQIAKRNYDDGWKVWADSENKPIVITCGTGKDYTSLVDCLDYVTSDALRNTWDENNRLLIKLDAGTFSMNAITDLYNQDSTRYKWGLYIPRYCTIQGAGKDKTLITYDYSGTDDWILGHLSPFNMPYESELRDLTITAKNCRYCVHSDGDEPFNRSWALNNNKIHVENVKMVHNGYSSGNNPTYNVPSAWGSGIRSGVTREFINCEFIAYHMPWFCHNTIGQDAPSYILFNNCKFINKKEATMYNTGNYESVAFISWGTGEKTYIKMENCYLNRCAYIRNATTYNQSATCDYYLDSDGFEFVAESGTNNAYLLDTWCNRNCVLAVADQAVTGYKPVTVTVNGSAVAYSAGTYQHGIAINSCDADGTAVVQTKGLVSLPRLGISGRSVGDLLGYSGGAWVVDSNNPIIEVLDAYIGEIV